MKSKPDSSAKDIISAQVQHFFRTTVASRRLTLTKRKYPHNRHLGGSVQFWQDVWRSDIMRDLDRCCSQLDVLPEKHTKRRSRKGVNYHGWSLKSVDWAAFRRAIRRKMCGQTVAAPIKLNPVASPSLDKFFLERRVEKREKVVTTSQPQPPPPTPPLNVPVSSDSHSSVERWDTEDSMSQSAQRLLENCLSTYGEPWTNQLPCPTLSDRTKRLSRVGDPVRYARTIVGFTCLYTSP